MSSAIANPTLAALCFGAEREKAGAATKAVTAGRALLAAGLLLTPLAFGAVEPWAWGTLAVVAAILLWFWTAACVGQRRFRLIWSPLYLPAAAFFVFALMQLASQSIRQAAGTREPLLKLVTDMLFFFVALQFWTTASRQTWRRLGMAVAVLAFSLSVLAIVQFFSNPNLIYWFVKPRWGGWIFGPYVNHNHYAGLMEMLIPVAAGFLLSLHAHSPGRALVGFAILVPVASVLLSGSRGGFIALLVESGVFFAILLRFGPAIGRPLLAVGAGLGVTMAALIFFWLDPGAVAGHLATVFERQPAPQIEAGFEVRLTLSEDALRMFRDHLWVGTGLGSFEAVYPQYQSFASDKLWEHAHDDYAEALAETGLVGGALIAAAIILFLRLAFGNLARRLSEPAGWIRLGAAIGCCGLLIHSLFDFNLHIPANAAWFAACAAWATCRPSSRRSLGEERA